MAQPFMTKEVCAMPMSASAGHWASIRGVEDPPAEVCKTKRTSCELQRPVLH